MTENTQGNALEIDAVKFNTDGEPYTFLNGQKIVLDGGIPGDILLARIIKKGQKISFATVKRIEKASPFRTFQPLCSNTNCPGCALQKVNQEYQSNWKKQLLSELFAITADFITASPLHYRNKIILPAQYNPVKNSYEAGLYQKNSHQIAEWHYECPVCLAEISLILKDIINYLNEHKMQTTQIIPLNQIFIRGTAESDFQCGLIIKSAHPAIEDICKSIVSTSPQIKSFFYEINSGSGNSVLIKNPVFITETETVDLSIGNKSYKTGPQTFFQANLQAAGLILEKINIELQTVEYKTVFDICSGVGVLSGGLNDDYKRYCFEYNADSFSYLSDQDKINSNFIITDMAKLHLSDYPKPDVIILDPPRKGVDAGLLREINQSMAKCIIYLSCNPLTQKRDLEILSNYRLTNLTGFDMFPQTPHIESLAVLHKI